MKIINLHINYKKLIKKALKNDAAAQRKIYNEFSPKMLGVCRQYIKDIHYAEDVMVEGFLKVFTNLQKFNFEGSFEGWIRKIIVNHCISFLRKNNKILFTDDEQFIENKQGEKSLNLENTTIEDVQKIIDALPNGYKIIFNLYAIEGFKHKEIAIKLGISESTSKSQLHKARKLLQKKYSQLNSINYGIK